MRKLLATATLVTSTLLIPGVVPEAHAGGRHHDWFAVGSGFRVGAAHISFVFGRPLPDYGPAYYFRYDRPIRYHGHSCNRFCYRDAGHYYHHEACPVVSAHFSRYDYDPYYAFSRYAPRYDGYRDTYRGRYRDYGYRDHGYRDRGYRDRGYHRDGYRDRGYRDRGYHRDDHRYRDRDYRRGYRQGYRDHDRYDDRRDRRHHRREHRHGPGCRH